MVTTEAWFRIAMSGEDFFIKYYRDAFDPNFQAIFLSTGFPIKDARLLK